MKSHGGQPGGRFGLNGTDGGVSTLPLRSVHSQMKSIQLFVQSGQYEGVVVAVHTICKEDVKLLNDCDSVQ